MLRKSLLALAALMSLAPAAARADEPPTGGDKDVRCLVVAYALANGADASSKQIGAVAFAYYLGRLDGRTPDLDLEARLRAAIPQVTADTFQTQMAECAGPLRERLAQLRTIGDHLKDEADKLPKPGAAPATPPP
jgi:hypothetical protein